MASGPQTWPQDLKHGLNSSKTGSNTGPTQRLTGLERPRGLYQHNRDSYVAPAAGQEREGEGVPGYIGYICYSVWMRPNLTLN